MGRKIFQHFAHVLGQKFIQTPSSLDVARLAIFGDGILVLDMMSRRAIHNGLPIEPLSYMDEAKRWLDARMMILGIPSTELVGASLRVVYSVILSRRPGLNWLSGDFDFSCIGEIASPDRKYSSPCKGRNQWSLAGL
jgi:hypothetical protein